MRGPPRIPYAFTTSKTTNFSGLFETGPVKSIIVLVHEKADETDPTILDQPRSRSLVVSFFGRRLHVLSSRAGTRSSEALVPWLRKPGASSKDRARKQYVFY